MNRHSKLAIMIAPFLAIGGYIASDYYVKHEQDSTEQYLKVTQEGPCDLVNTTCQFEADRLSMTLRHNNGQTVLESTFPLSRAVISWVDNSGKETRRQLQPDEAQRVWSSESNFAETLATEDQLTVRVAAVITNLHYLHEFTTGR